MQLNGYRDRAIAYLRARAARRGVFSDDGIIARASDPSVVIPDEQEVNLSLTAATLWVDDVRRLARDSELLTKFSSQLEEAMSAIKHLVDRLHHVADELKAEDHRLASELRDLVAQLTGIADEQLTHVVGTAAAAEKPVIATVEDAMVTATETAVKTAVETAVKGVA